MRNTWKGKKVFLTGHTGFKGSWLSALLLELGAEVTGYALPPEENAPLYDLLHLGEKMHSVFGDVRDFESLRRALTEAKPDTVLHLAAQPIVRESYRIPRETYEINVMGTVNLLEAVRLSGLTPVVCNVTTDKVYENLEWLYGYRETDRLNGYDPYSNSKSCSELVTDSYRKSFFQEAGIPVLTARAGNVIGGGDYALDRILPDAARAAAKGEALRVRNPHSIRPYQHVLEPLIAYLKLTERIKEDPSLPVSYNIGPEERDCRTTGELVRLFGESYGRGFSWYTEGDQGPHEAAFLRLDTSLITRGLGIRPALSLEEAVKQTAEWYRAHADGEDMEAFTEKQIRERLLMEDVF